MAAPLVEGFMMWRCKCGKTSFRHHEHCDSCGEERPAPPPEAEPSDKAPPDSGGPVTGGMDMGLDVAIRDKRNFYKKVGNYYGQFSNDVSMTEDLEAQMQRADEPAVLTTIKCPHCGDVTEQSFMLSEFTCGSCDEPFQP